MGSRVANQRKRSRTPRSGERAGPLSLCSHLPIPAPVPSKQLSRRMGWPGRQKSLWGLEEGLSHPPPPWSYLPRSSRSPLSYDIAGFGAPWEESGSLTLLATTVAPSKDGKHGHVCGLDKPSQSILYSPLKPQAGWWVRPHPRSSPRREVILYSQVFLNAFPAPPPSCFWLWLDRSVHSSPVEHLG